jgi:opacity protein-like surface antigen
MFRMMTSAAVMTLLLTSLAAAQARSTTHGLVIGANGQGVVVKNDEGTKDQGGGAGFDVAWGFRNGLSIFLSGAAAQLEPEDAFAEDYTFGHGDFGVRYMFRNDDARLRPFAELAASTVHMEQENVDLGPIFGRSDVTVSGPALTVGGGLGFYITPSTALDLGLRWSKGSFNRIEADGVTVDLDDDDYDLTAYRLRAGLRYHFSGN